MVVSIDCNGQHELQCLMALSLFTNPLLISNTAFRAASILASLCFGSSLCPATNLASCRLSDGGTLNVENYPVWTKDGGQVSSDNPFLSLFQVSKRNTS